jgi:peptide/nickel transport system permease protein
VCLRARLRLLPAGPSTSVLTFLLFYLLPGDPAAQALGRAATPEKVALVRHRMGLDLPA